MKSDVKTYNKIRKIATSQGNGFITGCLLDYPYFRKFYNLIPIDISKQQKLDAHSKAIQQINFTGNLNSSERATMFFY